MTLMAGGRRRAQGVPGGWHASIPQADLDAHGAGYPLTYAFTVPDQPGLQAQWRPSATGAWSTLPALPTGQRVDGIAGARFAGTTAYISKEFVEGSRHLYLRIVDAAGAEVTTAAPTVCTLYDDRAAAVAFTYDDTPEYGSGLAGNAAHAATRLWYSPGINAARLDPSQFTPTKWRAQDLAAAVADGYCEPSNHGNNHVNSSNYTSLTDARTDIIGGRDGILAATTMPQQSRGRIHAYIYPNGTHNEWAYQAIGEAGHLTARMTLSQSVPVTGGTYTPNAWSDTWGFVPIQYPSVASSLTTVPAEEVAARVAKTLDAITYAKSVKGQCMIYSYFRHWDWTPGQGWPQMIAQIGAMTDIWSVGQGHLALYQRTRDRVTITAA